MGAADLFDLPSAGDLAEIASELHLSDVQKHELDLTLRHAHADLEGFFRTRLDRSDRARRAERLKAFHGALASLLDVMGENPVAIEDLNDCLPFEARETIGKGVSKEVAETISGRAVHALRGDDAMRSVGLLHGAHLLAAQLRLIKAPIDAWLNAYVADPGGVEPDHMRNHVIRALAHAAPAILGRRATATAGGRFARLVAAVFHACELDDTGLEARIGRVLATRRKSSS